MLIRCYRMIFLNIGTVPSREGHALPLVFACFSKQSDEKANPFLLFGEQFPRKGPCRFRA